MSLEFECIAIEKSEDTSAILGHAGFIRPSKTSMKLWCVLSWNKIRHSFRGGQLGPCLVRSDGNDEGLRRQAESSILKIAAGHTFLILFKEAYAINVINNVRNVSEVAAIYCATSNPLRVIVAKVEAGRSVVGVVDGFSPRGTESQDNKQNRSKLLRDIGYKK